MADRSACGCWLGLCPPASAVLSQLLSAWTMLKLSSSLGYAFVKWPLTLQLTLHIN